MSWYIKPYYLLNYCLCMVFPLFRLYADPKNQSDKENHIIASFTTIIILRYLRYYTTFQMFIYDTIYYLKFANLAIFFFINYKYALWYAIVTIILQILTEIPKYTGPTKILPIVSLYEFNTYVINNPSKKLNYSLVLFKSPLSTKCIFTDELWAKLSIKYCVNGFIFYSVNVDNLNDVCVSQGIKVDGLSVELPILVLYKDGVELKRFPTKDKKGNTHQARFYSTKELISYFEMERIYSEVLKNK